MRFRSRFPSLLRQRCVNFTQVGDPRRIVLVRRWFLAMQFSMLGFGAMGCTSEPVGPLRAKFEKDLERPHQTLPWVMAPPEEETPAGDTTEVTSASLDEGPRVP